MLRQVHKLKVMLSTLLRGEQGASAIEYAVLASSIVALVVLTIAGIGGNLNSLYDRAASLIGALLP